MPAYDGTAFDPPAPVARVALRNPATDQQAIDVPMLIDSGSDVTLIPGSVVALLNPIVEPWEGYELTGFDGSRSSASAVYLHLFFLGRVFRGRFVVGNQEWGVLGRNVLNHVPLLLDGPHLTWSEAGPGTK